MTVGAQTFLRADAAVSQSDDFLVGFSKANHMSLNNSVLVTQYHLKGSIWSSSYDYQLMCQFARRKELNLACVCGQLSTLSCHFFGITFQTDLWKPWAIHKKFSLLHLECSRGSLSWWDRRASRGTFRRSRSNEALNL